MSGNSEGGKKAAAKNKRLYGDNFYKQIGQLGGKAPKSTPSGFAADPERARRAGQKGGLKTWDGRRAYDRY